MPRRSGQHQERQRTVVVGRLGRTRSQSTRSWTARSPGSSVAKSQRCSFSEHSFSVTTRVGDNIRILIARTSTSSADSIVAASTGKPLCRCNTSTTSSPSHALTSQSSGVRSTRKRVPLWLNGTEIDSGVGCCRLGRHLGGPAAVQKRNRALIPIRLADRFVRFSVSWPPALPGTAVRVRRAAKQL